MGKIFLNSYKIIVPIIGYLGVFITRLIYNDYINKSESVHITALYAYFSFIISTCMIGLFFPYLYIIHMDNLALLDYLAVNGQLFVDIFGAIFIVARPAIENHVNFSQAAGQGSIQPSSQSSAQPSSQGHSQPSSQGNSSIWGTPSSPIELPRDFKSRSATYHIHGGSVTTVRDFIRNRIQMSLNLTSNDKQSLSRFMIGFKNAGTDHITISNFENMHTREYVWNIKRVNNL